MVWSQKTIDKVDRCAKLMGDIRRLGPGQSITISTQEFLEMLFPSPSISSDDKRVEMLSEQAGGCKVEWIGVNEVRLSK